MATYVRPTAQHYLVVLRKTLCPLLYMLNIYINVRLQTSNSTPRYEDVSEWRYSSTPNSRPSMEISDQIQFMAPSFSGKTLVFIA